MLLDPTVQIECDHCEHFETYDLTATAGKGCYDERNVRSQSMRNGWIWVGDNVHFCSAKCEAEFNKESAQ